MVAKKKSENKTTKMNFFNSTAINWKLVANGAKRIMNFMAARMYCAGVGKFNMIFIGGLVMIIFWSCCEKHFLMTLVLLLRLKKLIISTTELVWRITHAETFGIGSSITHHGHAFRRSCWIRIFFVYLTLLSKKAYRKKLLYFPTRC